MSNPDRKKRFYILGLLAIGVFGLALVGAHKAYAIFMTSTRIIIEDGENAGEFLIMNRSEKTKLVKFEWKRRYVRENGQFKALKEGETYPGYRPADPYLRFSPRQALLKPGQRQKVRFYAKRTADMEEGEYHSHFSMEAIPEHLDKNIKQGKGDIFGKINIVAGANIPVFLRHGKTHVDVKIEEAFIDNDGESDYLNIKAINNSTRTTYGDVIFNCVQASGEVLTRKATVLRLYPVAPVLTSRTPITDFPVRSCATLKITVSDKEDFEYGDQPFAEAPVSIR